MEGENMCMLERERERIAAQHYNAIMQCRAAMKRSTVQHSNAAQHSTAQHSDAAQYSNAA
jgi:hypothetical protein